MAFLRTKRAACAAGLVMAFSMAGCDGGGGTGTGGAAGSGGSAGSSGSGGSAGAGGTAGAGGSAAAPQDILTTDLVLDLANLTGTAKLVVKPATGAADVSLEVQGLTISSVLLDGSMVESPVAGGIMSVPVGAAAGPVTIDVAYSFPAKDVTTFDGWMPDSGVTFLWPYFCGNLFPCNSKPDDGVTFTMNVTGVETGLTAVYPKTTTSDAPSYMPAVAVGDFVKLDLGTTTAGTVISAWYLPGGGAAMDAETGTSHLLAVFDFFETTYGAYSFGPEAGSVAANWGPGAFGGMEHHPFFHVGKDDFGNEEVQAHEAAHGWYGDGVRIACWEDFVLSEGTVTYMAAHGLERVGGPDVWPDYVALLDAICTGMDVNTVALPDTCNQIDLLNDNLWSNVPYIKGACFYEEVADLIGQGLLDEALADFYTAHVGKAARMRDMIDLIEAKADPAAKDAIETLVTEWLLSVECPADYAARCGTHAM
jgi:aminopeptidase N